jgi:NADH:ubiquinone oxidoreductase subunit 6 (subunit J)
VNLTLAIIAILILGSAAVAMTRRNLIHSALLLVFCWAGVAVFYLWAGAEFVAFAQVLVYVGAISMVVLFAMLLTRQSRAALALPAPALKRAAAAVLAGSAVLGVLAAAILDSNFPAASFAAPPTATVRELGPQLMGTHAAAVLVIGVMLTVSLLGAIVLAAFDDSAKGNPP